MCNNTMIGAGMLEIDLNPTSILTGWCGMLEPVGPGTAFPRSKINPAYGIIPVTPQLFSLSTWYILNGRRNSFWLGNFTDQPSLTPLQAYQLDSKVDDGIPSTGVVRAFDVEYTPDYTDQHVINDDAAGYCVNDAAGTAYKLDNTTIQCAIILKK